MTDGDHSGDNARREAVLLAIEAFHAARAKLASLISVEGQLAWFFIDPLKVASDPSDGEQRAAYLMARAGICALFLRDPGSLALVHTFRGAYEKTESDDTLAIRDLAQAVEMNACAWQNREDVESIVGGDRAPELLHVLLMERFGTSAPLEAACENWLERHSKATRKGKLTTVGILTEILIHTGAYGTSKKRDDKNRQKTRDRVRKALGE